MDEIFKQQEEKLLREKEKQKEAEAKENKAKPVVKKEEKEGGEGFDYTNFGQVKVKEDVTNVAMEKMDIKRRI